MQLTKLQTIALLIGSSYATSIESVMNGTSDEKTRTGTKATTKNSLTKCDKGPADCTTKDETCAEFQVTDDKKVVTKTNQCIISKYCGTTGRIAKNSFAAACWTAKTEKEAAKAPEIFKVDDALKNLATIVLDQGKDSKLKTFDNIDNLKVSPESNYQDGWWILTDAKWVETDKPVMKVCAANKDCTVADTCCMKNYPDTNNTRCIAKSEAKGPKTIFPMTAFTPACMVDPPSGPPKSGKDDLAKKDLAKAAEDLKGFAKTKKDAAQTKAKYADMKADEKTAWDKTYDAGVAKADKKVEEWKKTVGYAALTTAQQAVYDAELLTWQKAVWEACKANADAVGCKESNALKDKEEKRRLASKFYTKDKDGRKKLNEADDAERKKDRSAIVAAAVVAAGAEGGSCSAEKKCTSDKHCCGTGTRKDGTKEVKLEGICMDSTSKKYKRFEFEYTATCGAKSMLASATALFAAAYLM